MDMPDTIGGMNAGAGALPGSGSIALNARTSSMSSPYKRKKGCKC